MAARFVASDSEHDGESEGATPVNPNVATAPHQRSKSTPGQNMNDDNMISNPFDDDFGDDPFAEDNPNNPFNNPFGPIGGSMGAVGDGNPFHSNININNNNDHNKRTDATQQTFQVKRSKTPEPEMPAVFNQANNPNINPQQQQQRGVNRRHSQPVNSMNGINNNMNLDDIFADFQPQTQSEQNIKINTNNNNNPQNNNNNVKVNHNRRPSLPQNKATAGSLSMSPNNPSHGHKKRSKSVFMARAAPKQSNHAQFSNKRRGSVKKANDDELSVAKKTGYDISYFIDKDVAYKYLCIICENVCRNAVELTCRKKRHLCCEYCIRKYFEIHGNKCPVHPEHTNLQYSGSKYTKYHIEALKVRCPYATASGIHGGCSWSDTLKNLDQHQIEHTKFIRCPFADYGCKAKLKIQPTNENGDDDKVDEGDNNNEEESNQETLEQHLIAHQHTHLVLLLKQTKQLNEKLNEKNKLIDRLKTNNIENNAKLNYVEKLSRIGPDNIWVLCGSHKFWKHKYNQLFTVNVQNELRTQIRIYDISKVANNSNIHTSSSSSSSNGSHGNSNGVTPSGGGGAGSIYDPTQSDSWDVGDLGVAHVNNKFHIPIWLMKKYPNLDVFNRDRFNSIIFRCGGHLIRDKKVTARCDAILLDNHYQPITNHAHHNLSNNAIPMQQLVGYKLNCFPNLPSKRYNCECVYSQRHGLIVVGGSGVDKNQINFVNQLKIRDEDVNITYNTNVNTVNKKSGNNDDEKSKNEFEDNMRLIAQKTSYPLNTTFNITLEWKSLSPVLRAREDTAMCLFNDKNISWKEYIMICGGWSNGCLRTCELYNFEANKWIQMPPMHCKHNAAGICEWKHNNSIIIVGGFNTEAHYASEYFDLIKQKWIKLPNTNYKHRYKPAVWLKKTDSLLNGIGGNDGGYNYNPQIICCAGSGVLKNEVGTVEYLDTRDNKWTTVKKPLSTLLGLGQNINANNWRMWRIFT